jgi:sulfide:quinone oxidoreductase
MLVTRKLARSCHLQVRGSVRWVSTFKKDKCKVAVVGGGMCNLTNRREPASNFCPAHGALVR